MFSISLNMQVTFKKLKGPASVKTEIPDTGKQVDQNKKSIPKTTSVDWWKLVKVTFSILRIVAWIVTLINS